MSLFERNGDLAAGGDLTMAGGVPVAEVMRAVDGTCAAMGDELDGEHAVTWDGRDGHGQPLAAGLYLLRLQAGATVQTTKVALVE